jgi:subtilisin family serine protease
LTIMQIRIRASLAFAVTPLLLASGLVAGGAGAGQALAQEPTAGTAPAGLAPAGSAPAGIEPQHATGQAVTLITGDTVQVQIGPDGKRTPLVDLTPRADGRQPAATFSREGDDIYVFPSDAAPLVATGALDRELFNVGFLAAQSYPDGTVPLIVQFEAAAAPARAADDLPGLALARNLESLHAMSGRLATAEAGRFWSTLVDPSQPGKLAGPAERITLDRPVQANLEQSVPQVGGPQAWAAGYDGTGVKVAVLDTGIDPAHPDLAGRVAASENFTPAKSAVDRHGHGTHVASILAGTGAASNGRYKGVAHGATLLSGKVLDDTGFGSESGVIDGMEWAVAQGARVVNMSLTSGVASDGSDTMSQAVDRLTASSGALFVVAGGNAFGFSRTPSPAAAPSALSVSQVTKADEIAAGSWGPVLGTNALKPEITAPGVSIVAARAAGTLNLTPVGEHYGRASGTSMAAPHVAGTAALLAQRFPQWRADRLKPAITSTAKDLGQAVYQQGAGRLDAGRALTQQVYSTTATLDFGLVEPGTAPATKTVTYANTGTAPVTLSLAASLRTEQNQVAPAGVLSLGADSVTVPAGGTADVQVTFSGAAAAIARYKGAVTASGPDGIALTTAVGLIRDADLAEVKFRIKDFRGEDIAFPVSMQLRNLDTNRVNMFGYEPLVGYGIARVAPGDYLLQISDVVIGPDAAGETQVALLQLPQFTIGGDTEVVLDARQAKPVSVRTPEPSESRIGFVGYERANTISGNLSGNGVFFWYPRDNPRVLPSGPVTKYPMRFLFDTWRGKPLLKMAATAGRTRLALDARYPLYNPIPEIPKLQGSSRLQLINVNEGTTDDFTRADVRGKLALVLLPDGVSPLERMDRLNEALRFGAAGVLLHSPSARPILPNVVHPLPTLSLLPGEAAQLLTMLRRERNVTIEYESTPVTPWAYRLGWTEIGKVPAGMTYQVSERDLATLDEHLHADVPGVALLWWRRDSSVFNSFSWPLQHPAQGRLKVYIARSSQPWWLTTVTDAQWAGYEVIDQREYTHHWGQQPASPGVEVRQNPPPLGTSSLVTREGDWIIPQHGWTSSQAESRHDYLVDWDRPEGDTARLPYEIHFFRGDQEIGFGRLPNGTPAFAVPAEAGTYRMTYNVKSTPGTAANGRTVSAEWTFGSERPSADQIVPGYRTCPNRQGSGADIGPCRSEQLLYLRYDLGLDLTNRLSRTLPKLATVTAYHQPSTGRVVPRIAGMRMWLSFDQGKLWRAVPVVPVGDGRFRVLLTHGGAAAGSAVSIRTEAWDDAGNRINMSTSDAYRLR